VVLDPYQHITDPEHTFILYKRVLPKVISLKESSSLFFKNGFFILPGFPSPPKQTSDPEQ
jgi:hypothetical protein